MAKNEYRTCTVCQISEKDIGKTVKMAGWVENIRDHGGVSFIDLRDHYGVMQVVLHHTELLKGIVKEECVSVTGVIEQRDEETYNPKIATGTIELNVSEIRILGKVKEMLPFEVATSHETKEDLRLMYRFLDLRNRKVHDNIVFRSEVLNFTRNKMHELGFTEIQTPILSASCPAASTRVCFMPCRKRRRSTNSC
jgi:aspartyl-tRNA synthetase